MVFVQIGDIKLNIVEPLTGFWAFYQKDQWVAVVKNGDELNIYQPWINEMSQVNLPKDLKIPKSEIIDGFYLIETGTSEFLIEAKETLIGFWLSPETEPDTYLALIINNNVATIYEPWQVQKVQFFNEELKEDYWWLNIPSSTSNSRNLSPQISPKISPKKLRYYEKDPGLSGSSHKLTIEDIRKVPSLE